jgi:hypothetical protein
MPSSSHSFRTRFEQGAIKAFSAFDAMTDEAQKQLWSLARTASQWGRRAAEELSQVLARAEARAGRSAR